MQSTALKIAMTLTLLSAAVPYALGMEVRFEGGSHKVIEVTPERKTGLEKVYVAYDAGELTEMRVSGAGSGLQISRFGNMGGGYAEPVTFSWDGADAVVHNPRGNMGYIFTRDGRNTCIWLVNYADQPFDIRSLKAADTQDCDYTHIDIDGEGKAINIYTIDGRPEELSREIRVEYTTEEWNESDGVYDRVPTTKILADLPGVMTLTPPLYCSTSITVTGDRFMEEWGMAKSAVSATIMPNGLAAHTQAVQTNLPDEGEESDPSNIINGESSAELGGSAPAVIKFTASVTEAVIHDEWQLSRDPEFQNTEYRFTEREVEYTFEEEGTYYMRYVGSNADGSCDVYSDVYTIGIGASDLRIPNAFSPNDDGVNDVWKVAYRSLLDFKCWIFDRYGNQIFHFTDPSKGWDGKYKGKTVKPGVYYYVIEAKGSDGTKYKKSGDINIVNYKKAGTATGPVD